MNYLAHFHLAQANDSWIVGALLGEYIKGPLKGEWPATWEQGMQLHRQIDAFSDRHPARMVFAQLLPPAYRRYAGIVLDVYCDYWLSLHWQRFHAQSLPEFANRVYALLARDKPQLSPAAAQMAQRLIDYDVLCIYREWQTLADILTRIGQRLTRANPLHRAGVELHDFLPAAEPVFLQLYPALIEQVQRFSVAQLNY